MLKTRTKDLIINLTAYKLYTLLYAFIVRWQNLETMEEITIYKYQMAAIYDALRITANIHGSRDPHKKDQTCHDRQVRQSEQFAKNALEGNYKKEVKYIG